MTWTYEPSTDIGRVRRTIPDRVEEDGFWTDEEIQSFLDDEDGWRRATALALETMASDAAIVDRVIKIQNLTTDGAAVSRALMARALQLRTQAQEADASSGDAFDTIEVIVNDFGWRDRVLNEAIKSV